MSTNIKILQDLDNNTFYPKTHTQAIIDNNSTTLEDRLEGIEGNILPSGGTNGLILEKDDTLSTGAKWVNRTQISVGTTTTGEPGTNANVTNSGTATNPILDFSIPRGADAINPFKGYYPTGVSLPTTGTVGDYLYAPPSDSQSTATATIWHYDSTQTPPWTDTEIDVSAVVALEFGSGQAVTATKIKDENGEEVQGAADVLSAEAGLKIGAKLEGVTAEETKQTEYTTETGNVKPDGSLYTSGTHVVIALPSGTNRVRFLAQTVASLSDINLSYAFWNSESYVDESTVVNAVPYKQREGSSNYAYEVIEKVPLGATHIAISLGSVNTSNFYCYTVVGDTVIDVVNKITKCKVEETLNMVAGVYSKNTGNIIGATDLDIRIFKNYINILFLDLEKVNRDSLILSASEASVIYFCFDENFSFLGYGETIIDGTRYVRFECDFLENQQQKILQVNLSFDAKQSDYWVKDGLKQGEMAGSRVQWLTIEVDTPNVNGDYVTTADYSSGQAQRDFTNGCLRYAVDYSNTGKPTPLIILFHGTSGYAFNKSSFTNEEEARYSFLAKCGYNVVDVSSVTYRLWYASDPSNENNRVHGANFCYPVSEKNYIAIFEYVCKYFNIDRSRVYGLAKSAGGMLSTLFSTRLNSEIPLRATAQIAPGICTTINMLEITAVLNNFYLAQIGCQNPQVTGGLSGGNYDGRPAIQTDKDYILANLDKICRYDPFLTNTIGLDYTAFITQVLDTGNDNAELTGNTDIANLVSSAVKIYSCPVKIWHSRDDDRVPYIQSKWVVDMGSRAGQEIFLRTFPDEHGGHFIDGFLPSENNPNPTLTDYTNKFGVTLSDVSVVYSEVVDWFNRW